MKINDNKKDKMKRTFQFFVFLLMAITSLNTLLVAQTGPGGIGNALGVNGPLNLFWLDASDLNLTNGNPVTIWEDKTSNNIDFGPSVNDEVNPIYNNTDYSFPVVRFSSASGTGSKLIVNPINNFPENNISVIIVYQSNDANEGLLSYAVSTADNNEFLLLNSSNQTFFVTGSNIRSGYDFRNAGFQIATHKWRNSDGALRMFQNGTQVYSTNGFRSGQTFADGGSFVIGGEQDDVDGGYASGQALDGDIAEIILFDAYINDAQRTIIENYLNVKYGITISNDVFAHGDPSYTYDLTGIGQELDGNHTSSVSGTTGFYVKSAGSLDNGDYIMFAHNNSVNSVSTSDITGGVQERWAKDWYLEQTGSQNAQIIFDLPEGVTGGQYPQNISNYVLLYRSGTTGNYSVATTSSVDYADADQVAFSILGTNLTNGYYTLGTLDQTNSPVLGQAGTTWYTLVTGDWTDPDIWTLDPSGALPNNPTNSYPQNPTDKVVIKTGKTVTMDLPNPTYTFASITVNGRLDLQSKSGLTFSNIKGTGRILMSDDVFPLYSNADDFIKAGEGEGTVVLYGNNFTLNTSHEFFNLEVEMNIGQTVTLTQDLTLNGHFRVETGTFQINDNSSTNNLNISVAGDVNILAGAFLNTGTGNARHQFDFYGDLTNNGELRFTNRTSADYTNEATDGIVDANFLSSASNQNIICNGISNFYRIEIDKGSDKTYALAIEASSTANFNLFGYANQPHNDIVQLDDSSIDPADRNINALGLYRGTVKIGNNVVINHLCYSANYNISEAAKLWIDGGTVYNNNGSATVTYGTLEVSAGLIESKVTSGITLRDNALIKVSGGTINTRIIRTSVLGSSNIGAYVQSGGTVNILSEPNSGDYYHFCLTYTGNVFNMSGGTLHITDANGSTPQTGGIFINSDPENINVTGGTIIAHIENSTSPFKITSRAPFYNLILRNTNINYSEHVLDAGANVGSTNESLAAQPLIVLNDFTIEGNAAFKPNSNNVNIGRNFTIEENGIYDEPYSTTLSAHTLTFNGTEAGIINLQNITETGGQPIGAHQRFYNIVIDKPEGVRLRLNANASKSTSTWANNLIQVTNDFQLLSGTFDQANYSLRMDGTVTIQDTLGIYYPSNLDAMIKIAPSQATTINTSEGAVIGNFRVESYDEIITFTSDIYIKRVHFMAGRIYMGSHNLKVDAFRYTPWDARASGCPDCYSDSDGRGCFSVDDMVIFDGNASDGGLSLYIPSDGLKTEADWLDLPDGTNFDIANNEFLFPIGIGTDGCAGSAKYTPAVVGIYNTTDDGYITIRPVDAELKTTDLSGGDLLNYYWRIDYDGFSTLPTVEYDFFYDESDVVGNESQYRPGFVLDEEPYTRDSDGNADGVDDSNNIINFDNGGSGFTLARANYTAGNVNRFNGNLYVYYSEPTGNLTWSNNNHWHRDSPTGPNFVPTDGSIVKIMGDARVNVYVASFADIAMLEFENTNSTPNSENVGRLQFHVDGTYDIGSVRDTGMISFNATRTISLNADLGDFASNPESYYLYFGGNATLNNIPTPIPNLMLESFDYVIDQAIVVNSDLIIQGNSNVTPSQDIEIKKDLVLGYWLGGTFHFPSTGTSRTITVEGNIDYTQYTGTGSPRDLVVDNPGSASTLEHKLILHGDIIHGGNNTHTFDLFNAIDRPAVILELKGNGNNSYYRTSTSIPDLYRVVMNKGSDQSNTFTFSDDVTLSGPTSGTGVLKALEMKNGTLILNDIDLNFDLTTGDDDFYLPSTACLEVKLGQANASGGSGIDLDGKLIVSGGTIDMTGGNNYIEYSASGNATIEITDGTLSVGSQVRRSLASDQGILIFSQSGGTVNIGVSASPENKRGIFEILNTGSSFTHSGGDFYIVNDYRSNPSTQSFYFDPETVNLSTGTTITFGNANTIAAERFFTIYAGQNLMNLAINNTSTFNPTLTLNVVPLTLDENLTLNTGTSLDANGLAINISGNFNNAGTFTANGNTTVFQGINDQVITGATTFYNLTKNTANNLSLGASSEITVENFLSLEDGTFNDNDNNVNVKGDLYSIIATASAGASDGVIMNGTAEQEITGNGTYAKLTINNPNGILVPTGNTITIDGNLKMQSGIFDIGRNLLVLNENAGIEEASPFSESNMIQTNISFTDAGVRKYFPAINTPLPGPTTQFIYPMGSVGKYTPVQFDIETCDAGGSIRVRAADERHISIIDDTEDPEIDDLQNVLQYHWTLDANNITGFSATATMESYPDDVMVTSPYTVADYITASLIDTDLGTWSKYSTDDFNEATNELYFYFAGTNDLGIDGDYTAGIDDAIPDQVPSYISTTDGPWNDAATWETYPVAGGLVPAGGPRGAIVYIEHEVTMPVNFMAAYITNIGSTGRVSIGTTFGHRLGIVNGTGELYLQRGDLPAGVYDGFFAPDSGTIIFNGITDYDILSEITYVNNLKFLGTGERRFPNLSLTIFGDLTIGDGGDVPIVINEHYQTISVHKDVHFNSGTFTAGFGNDATFRLAGNTHQTIYGDFTGTNAFWNFEINNPNGASLSTSDIEIDNELYLTSGVITSSSTNTITLDNQNENIVTGGSNSSYVNGPLFKNIINGQSFYFPVGNSGRYGEVFVQSDNSNATGYWQAQYYNQNPGSAGYDPTIFNAPLTMVSNSEYWRILSPTGSDDASIGLRWNGQSGMPTSDASDISQLRIVEWRDPDNNPDDGSTADNLWENIGGSYTTSSPGTSGTISSDAVITFDEFTGTGNIFTLSSEATASSPVWEGDVSSDWHTPGNWSTNSVPTSLDAVSIPNTGVTNEPVISSGAVAGATNIESNRTLTITANGSLTLSGNLTMDGDIIIESNATGTGSLLDNGTIAGSGTATVQRYISGNYVYHYISPPLSAIPHTTYSIAPWGAVNPNFYIYDETNNNPDWNYGWILGSTITPNMDVGRGYAFAFNYNNTFTMTGGSFNTGTISQAVTNSGHGVSSDGWNLIGNPYPSAISAEDFLTANAGVIEGTVYFWDDDGTGGDDYTSSDYATWNLAGAIGSSSGSGSKVPDGFISNGQGFLVEKMSSAPVSENITFTNSMRRIGNGQFFKSAPTDDIMRIRLSLTNDIEKLYNEALIVFIHGATDGHDHFFDGRKNKGNSDIAFYSLLNNEEYAIQSFKPLSNKTNNIKEIPMGYSVSKDGNYSFNSVQFENIASDFNVYLEDKLEKETINLKEVQNYSFATLKGTFNDRFVLRFNYKNENTNSAPILREKLANIATLEDESFGYKISENAFGDVDVNDELSYTARLADGSNLPSWLNFNNQTLDLIGTPTNDDVELITIELTATDLSGESVSDIFTLEVINVNDAPELINEIADQEINKDAIYSFTIPANTFEDVDAGDVLTYSVSGTDGSLPDWLSFDNENRTLSGIAANVGDIDILVTATDKAGVSVSDNFILSVKNTTNTNDLEFGEKIKIYPNPTDGQLSIETDVFETGTKFVVRNYNGKTIIEKLAVGTRTDFNLSEFADGVYFIEMKNNEKSQVFKVILNK